MLIYMVICFGIWSILWTLVILIEAFVPMILLWIMQKFQHPRMIRVQLVQPRVMKVLLVLPLSFLFHKGLRKPKIKPGFLPKRWTKLHLPTTRSEFVFYFLFYGNEWTLINENEQLLRAHGSWLEFATSCYMFRQRRRRMWKRSRWRRSNHKRRRFHTVAGLKLVENFLILDFAVMVFFCVQ